MWEKTKYLKLSTAGIQRKDRFFSLNWQPPNSQAGTQHTEPHQPGLCQSFIFSLFSVIRYWLSKVTCDLQEGSYLSLRQAKKVVITTGVCWLHCPLQSRGGFLEGESGWSVYLSDHHSAHLYFLDLLLYILPVISLMNPWSSCPEGKFRREVSWTNYSSQAVATLRAQLILMGSFLHCSASSHSSSETTFAGLMDDVVIRPSPSSLIFITFKVRLQYLSSPVTIAQGINQEALNCPPHIFFTMFNFSW